MSTMMNQDTYDSILEILSREPTFNEGKRQLQKSLPEICKNISDETLKSIQAQFYVRRMRRGHFHHYNRENRERYYELYKEAKSRNEKNVIVRLAAKNDISPCLLARIVLEEYYLSDVHHEKDDERSDGRGVLPPGLMTDCIRDIAKIPDPELAQEIYETTVIDNFYGPAVDSIKKSCGAEYELLLRAKCKKAGLCFIGFDETGIDKYYIDYCSIFECGGSNEDQMREEGYDKTPDIRLKIPVLMYNRVVNWIESKASFGDPSNHQQYQNDQYLPYKNRFGPGAVIYWFGFVEELAETGERGILLLSDFPDDQHIVRLQDLHEKEKTHVEFGSLKTLNKIASICDNDDEDDMEEKFRDYVDPMFDSDNGQDWVNFQRKKTTKHHCADKRSLHVVSEKRTLKDEDRRSHELHNENADTQNEHNVKS